MKVKQRIDIEELGRHLLSERALKENRIILNEDTSKVIAYCMNIFLEELKMQNQRKEEKEFNYLYNNFMEDMADIVDRNEEED